MRRSSCGKCSWRFSFVDFWLESFSDFLWRAMELKPQIKSFANVRSIMSKPNGLHDPQMVDQSKPHILWSNEFYLMWFLRRIRFSLCKNLHPFEWSKRLCKRSLEPFVSRSSSWYSSSNKSSRKLNKYSTLLWNSPTWLAKEHLLEIWKKTKNPTYRNISRSCQPKINKIWSICE